MLLPSYRRNTAKHDVNPTPICRGSAPLENRNLPLKTFPFVNKTYVITNKIPVERKKLIFITFVHLRNDEFDAIAVINAMAKKIYGISAETLPVANSCLKNTKRNKIKN